jgi:transposase, IS5 family
MDFAAHGRLTRKAKFLIEMNGLIPWAALCELIAPHYPKVGNGRPPIGLERMLRLHFLQLWFNLADEACEEALYDTALFCEFSMIDLGEERVPDATSLLRFRHLLEAHGLGQAILASVNELLAQRGLKVAGGTMVDATIIAAPSSTKNIDQARDPEMHQTKKGNQWHLLVNKRHETAYRSRYPQRAHSLSTNHSGQRPRQSGVARTATRK